MKLRPKLLAYIFDMLVKALQIKPTIRLDDLPRMADFAAWGEAISRALGNKPLEFINAYYENIGRQNIEAIEAHPLGQVVAKYFEIDGNDSEDFDHITKVLEGSPVKILEILEVFAEENKINIDHKLWPKSPNVLTRRLNQIRSNLLEGLGIDVSISRITTSSKNQKNKINTSYIKIWKIPPIPPIPPEEQKHEGNPTKSTGDISSTGDIIPPVNEIPPVRNYPDHTQKSDTGDTGDTGGIFLTSSGGQTATENLIIQKMPYKPRFDCYYCDGYQGDIEADYERHVVLKHPRKQAYPSKVDLENLGIHGKGKEWEI
jgi:hypothetical protein